MAAHVLKLSHVRPVVVGILILIKDVEKEKFGSLILIYQDVEKEKFLAFSFCNQDGEKVKFFVFL